MMNYAVLGNSGLNISRIGLGCMSLSASKEQEGLDVIRMAIDKGINFLDTADLYERGLNERLLGKAVRGVRQKVVLATKVGNQWRADGSGWDWNPRKSYILQAADESLKRLQTDYIDLYQLHGGTIEDSIDETIEAFEMLISQGKILHYGISSIRPNVIRAYVEKSRIASVMLQYSLLDRRPEESVLDLLHSNGIGVLVRGALAQGLLVDKPGKAYLCHTQSAVQAAKDNIRQQIGEDGSASQSAIRYVLKHPAVTAAVVGTSNTSQIREVAHVFDERVSDINMLDFDNDFPPCRYTEHR
jgi:aryl-alcohol dehydrogenase-like predicted oxidoreductase